MTQLIDLQSFIRITCHLAQLMLIKKVCMKIAFMEITSSPRVALIVVAAMFLHYNATAIPTVNLGTASSFAILSASEITDAGGASTIVAGDVGLSPATGAAIGLTPGQVLNGTILLSKWHRTHSEP
jgi:hypothetical protein